MSHPPTELEALEVLRERQREIQQVCVEDQSISFDVDEWRRWFDGTYFEADDSCEVFNENLGAFTRADLFSLAVDAKDADH